ncbi:MAG: Dyp-type peroxidase [Alphaproteobacteria bacterium]|nr:Dyp-type peroxidase [Alphaproteobacteria bacterium]
MTSKNSSVNTKDVQGIFKGFGLKWPYGRFFYCNYSTADAGRELLNRLAPLTSFHDVSEAKSKICINAAFTFHGLKALDVDTEILSSLPPEFVAGMQSRADINGDAGESAPSCWEDIWKKHRVHIWVGVYAETEGLLQEWQRQFEGWVSSQEEGVTIIGSQDVSRLVSRKDQPVYIEDPASQPQTPVLLEHFGFRDGMGNPAIKGLVDKHVAGSGSLGVDGKWSALPTGEFLLGYVDSNGEIPIAPKPQSFSQNGTFMVLRKLAQDVDLFRDYLSELAGRLDGNADDIASRMVGRRRDGTPLIKDAKSDFDFTFQSDSEGRQCPMGSHMRRANPRDSFGEGFGSLLVDRHRILRRAITYGKLVEHGQRQAEVNGDDGQGLMFIVLNASISRQFEFVQQQWINYGNEFNQGNDRDPIVGLQEGGGQMVIPGDKQRKSVICDNLRQFVTCRGGDYFFLPGIDAFCGLAKG